MKKEEEGGGGRSVGIRGGAGVWGGGVGVWGVGKEDKKTDE